MNPRRTKNWPDDLHSKWNVIFKPRSLLLRTQINFSRGLSSLFAKLSESNGLLKWLPNNLASREKLSVLASVTSQP